MYASTTTAKGLSRKRLPGLLAVLAIGLMGSACSNGGALEGIDSFLGPSQSASAQAAGGGSTESQVPKSELDKALAYWGEEHNKKPADLQIALSYSRNLKAAGQKDQAFGVLQSVAVIHGDSKELASEMGRMALEYDQVGMAEKLLAMADDPAKPDWKLISARGTVMAKQNKFAEAIPHFERALQIKPNQPSVMNNLAMAHAANGDPAKAETILRQAIARSDDPKIRQNLALVLGLQNKHDEAGTVRAASATASTATADTEFVKKMVKATPATTPAQATPAIATAPAPRAAPAARVIEAKATAKQAKPSQNDSLRPAGGPTDVSGTPGAWSTSVSKAQ